MIVKRQWMTEKEQPSLSGYGKDRVTRKWIGLSLLTVAYIRTDSWYPLLAFLGGIICYSVFNDMAGDD